MADNFYIDNDDLQFHMEEMIDWKSIVDLMEDIGTDDCPYGSAEEATETYLDMLKDPVGSLAGARIAPRAEAVDQKGCTYEDGEVKGRTYEAGEVTFQKELQDNIAALAKAGLPGVTSSTEHGGM